MESAMRKFTDWLADNHYYKTVSILTIGIIVGMYLIVEMIK
jgi:hypothetical protein